MTNSKTIYIVAIMAAVCLGTFRGAGAAGKVTVTLDRPTVYRNAVSSEQGILLHFDVPSGLTNKQVDRAWLSVGIESSDTLDRMLKLACFPVNSQWSYGTLLLASGYVQFDSTPTAVTLINRGAELGTSHVWVIDVTELVAQWVENPQTNFGVCIRGWFNKNLGVTPSLGVSGLPGGAAATVEVYYSERQ